MDKIEKFLMKLSANERLALLDIFEKILNRKLDTIDVKKLVGEKDLYRIRKGKIQIIYRDDGKNNTIINVDYRGNIYK